MCLDWETNIKKFLQKFILMISFINFYWVYGIKNGDFNIVVVEKWK